MGGREEGDAACNKARWGAGGGGRVSTSAKGGENGVHRDNMKGVTRNGGRLEVWDCGAPRLGSGIGDM